MKKLHILISLCLTAPCFAEGLDFRSVLIRKGPERKAPNFVLGLRHYPTRGSGSQQSKLTEYDFQTRWELFKNQHSRASLTGQAALFQPRVSSVLPSGRNIPRELGTLSAGFQYSKIWPSQNQWGLDISLSSNSDKPFSQSLFGSQDVTSLMLNSYFALAPSKAGRWLFFLNFATNRGFADLIPLPGVAYLYQPNDQFTGVFGLPFFSLTYRPYEKLISFLLFFPPRSIRAQMIYFIVGPIQSFLSFKWSPETFARAERSQKDLRIRYDEKLVLVGLRSPVARGLFLELAGGYGFDRKLWESDSIFRSQGNEVNLAASWMLKTTLRITLGAPQFRPPPSKK